MATWRIIRHDGERHRCVLLVDAATREEAQLEACLLMHGRFVQKSWGIYDMLFCWGGEPHPYYIGDGVERTEPAFRPSRGIMGE